MWFKSNYDVLPYWVSCHQNVNMNYMCSFNLKKKKKSLSMGSFGGLSSQLSSSCFQIFFPVLSIFALLQHDS